MRETSARGRGGGERAGSLAVLIHPRPFAGVWLGASDLLPRLRRASHPARSRPQGKKTTTPHLSILSFTCQGAYVDVDQCSWARARPPARSADARAAASHWPDVRRQG